MKRIASLDALNEVDVYGDEITNFILNTVMSQTVSGQLGWSHICELLIIENEEKMSFYEKETVNSAWSIREMKRQIDGSLLERLLLSSGKANKEKVLELAQKGQEISKAEDLLKNPYVFEYYIFHQDNRVDYI